MDVRFHLEAARLRLYVRRDEGRMGRHAFRIK